MTEANHPPYVILAFSLGLTAGASVLLLMFRARGEQLRRKLAEGGYRLTDRGGKEFGNAELMALVATNSFSGTHSSPTRLLVVALGAAVAVAVAVVVLVLV